MIRGFWKGITWIEVAVLSGIFIILVVLTVPHYKKFQCRAMQSQAKNQLARAYTAQRFYEKEHGDLARFEELKRIGLTAGRDRWYRYFEKEEPNGKNFEIFAEGLKNSKTAGDLWSINQDREIRNIKNLCE